MKDRILRVWKYIRVMLGGIVMVVTDTIPGLSGSVFLSAGELLQPVWSRWRLILKPEKQGDRWRAVVFYIMFGIGTTFGMIGFAKLVEICLREIPSITFAFFFVAAIGGIFIFIKGNKKFIYAPNNGSLSKRGKIWLIILGLSVITALIIVFLITIGRVNQYDLDPKNTKGINIEDVKLMTIICLAGFFSAFAMFTPGLSGGLIILVFGVYSHIFGGLLAHPEKYIPEISVYGVSVMLGILTAIFTWDKMFTKHARVVIWILLGMIIASTLAIPILFDVFIPNKPWRWFGISGAVLSSGLLVYSTLKLMDHDHVVL